MTHVYGPVCEGCETKLDLAHPDLRTWFHRVKAQYPNTHIAWSWRSKADQDIAVKAGKSAAPWPTSRHNHMYQGKPFSLALDLFQQDSHGNASWSSFDNGKINKDFGAGMRWGGTFKSLGDSGHFELGKAPSE